METFASNIECKIPEFKAPSSHPSKLHLAVGNVVQTQVRPATQDSSNLLSQLTMARERTKILQKALMTEVKHHMDELLGFDDSDPFFNVFVEYHTQRIYSLQKALSAAFPDSHQVNTA